MWFDVFQNHIREPVLLLFVQKYLLEFNTFFWFFSRQFGFLKLNTPEQVKKKELVLKVCILYFILDHIHLHKHDFSFYASSAVW